MYNIAAVGNRRIWVMDTDENLEPGDYLFSSATEGHAMKDPGVHPVMPSYCPGSRNCELGKN